MCCMPSVQMHGTDKILKNERKNFFNYIVRLYLVGKPCYHLDRVHYTALEFGADNFSNKTALQNSHVTQKILGEKFVGSDMLYLLIRG